MMSALGLLNFLVLQWFGVRLARVKLPPGAIGYRVAANRTLKAGLLVNASDVVGPGRTEWWALMRWVWPLTGWWSDFRYIARRS